MEQAIRDMLRANPKTVALRTDLEKCFQTLPQARIIQQITTLPVAESVRTELLELVKTVPRGLPVGSPLSSWLAEFVLREIDAGMSRYPTYFRYVDDICVLGTQAQCIEALETLETIVASLRMALSKHKTAILPGQQLTFLGRSFQLLADSDLLVVDLGGSSFQLPNDKSLVLRVRKAGLPYQERPGEIIYNLDCVLNRMSQQPTPYLLEMLMLRPACSEKTLQQLIEHPNWVLDSGLPHALHGKIFRHYVRHVKNHGPANPRSVVGAAGEVYRWLQLAVHLMEQGQILSDYNDSKAEWNHLLCGLRKGDFEPYHQAVRRLFKREYALRNRLTAEGALLPSEKPAFAAFTAN